MAVESLDVEPGMPGSRRTGCCNKVPSKTIHWVLFACFFSLFWIAFGIGFAGGKNADAVAAGLGITAPAPKPSPPPYWVQPTTAPGWLGAPAFGQLDGEVLTSLTPSAKWDRITFDYNNGASRLFLGLGPDGLAMLPLSAPGVFFGAASTIIPNTANCNGLVDAGVLGFAGDSASFHSSGPTPGNGVTVINMATLVEVAIVPVANGVGVDNGVYDPQNNQVIMTLVNGSLMVLDSRTGALKRTVNNVVASACSPGAPCDPLEYPTVDGVGNLYINAADRNQVLKLSTTTFAAASGWPVDVGARGCINPTGLAIDAVHNHLFVGCSNPANPMLMVLDSRTGALVTTVPIGRGNDGVVFYKGTATSPTPLVIASSGTVGTLTVIQQNIASNPIGYAVREVLFTKVGARTVALDDISPNGPYLYTMSTDGVYNPRVEQNVDFMGGVFNPNSFIANDLDVLSYGPAQTQSGGTAAPPQPASPSWLGAPTIAEVDADVLIDLTPSANWDRITFDYNGGASRLFLGLGLDGLAVLPLQSPGIFYGAAAQAIPNTPNCNGIVVAGSLGFVGDIAGFTGSAGVFGTGVTVINMATLQVVTTVPVSQGVGVDNGVYDSANSQVIMTLVNGSLMVLDAATGALKRTVNAVATSCSPSAPCDPLEYPTIDTSGNLFINAADSNQVLKFSTSSFAPASGNWPVHTGALGCLDPTGLAIDVVHSHLFVGCGAAGSPSALPLLLVLDSNTGALITSVPIGRGNDGVAYYPGTTSSPIPLVIASGGAVGTLTIIQQNTASSPIGYAVRQARYTKVGARTLAVDTVSPGGPYIYTMSTDGFYDPRVAPNVNLVNGGYNPNSFLKNNLDVMAYAPAATAAAPPPALPQWLGSPAFGEVGASTIIGLTPAASWDRITFDYNNGAPRLFLGLGQDGLAVVPLSGPATFDVAGARSISGTGGCNGLVIAGSMGFAGDVAAFTGTAGVFGSGVTVINMATLTVVTTVPVSQGVGVDNGVYDSVNHQVIMTLVNGSLMVLDSRTGALKKTVNAVATSCSPSAPCDPLEYPTIDTSGNLFINAADSNQVLKLSTSTFAPASGNWPVNVGTLGCRDPTGMAIDTVHSHLFIGCGSAGSPENLPILLVLDSRTGALVASVPIGRGNDGVAFFPGTATSPTPVVVASSGAVGTLTVIQQSIGATPPYATREVLFTKVGARTLAMDTVSPSGPFIYTMSTDGYYDPHYPVNKDFVGSSFNPNRFIANNLDMLVYGPASGFVAEAPPPPFWNPGTVNPSWVQGVTFGERGHTVLNTVSPHAQWDRLTWDSTNGGRLFLGLQADGLVMVNLNSRNLSWAAGQNVSVIQGTVGCNGLVIAGNIGFAGNAAGYFPGVSGSTSARITVLSMNTTMPTVRSTVPASAGVDNGVYDMQNDQVIMTVVDGTLMVLSSITGQLINTVSIPGFDPSCGTDVYCDPLEYPVVDNAGSLFVNAADQNTVYKISTPVSPSSTFTAWDVSVFGCLNPTGLDVDAARRHLFIGCNNPANPMLLVISSSTGALVTMLPLGRGNDGVVYSGYSNPPLIFASSGTVGTLTIYQQNTGTSPASYAVKEVQFTKVGARTMAVDSTSAGGPYVYTMTTDGFFDPSQPLNADFAGGIFNPNAFLMNNLDLLQYGVVPH